MAETKPAAGSSRKQWDKGEWEAKAKAKDEEFAEKAKVAETAMKAGKKARFKEDLPVATKNLEARTEDLGLEKNLNKTVLVQTTTTGRGPRGAGFYCDLCNRTLKDSLSYLDHVNSRIHLRRLGQTTQVARSTLAQVRVKIRQLRESTASKVTAKNFDFNSRLDEVRKGNEDERQRRKEERKRKREERREDVRLGKMGVIKKARVEGDGDGEGDRKAVREEKVDLDQVEREHEDMAGMMGFGGFGGGKKR